MRPWLLLLILGGMGCQTVINIDPPRYDPELVATSFFAPDSVWSAQIHRSLGITTRRDAGSEIVDNATVVILSGPDIVDTLSHLGAGLYVSARGRTAEVQTRYTLRVTAPEASPLEGESMAPIPAPITAFSLERAQDASSDAAYRLRFRITDPPGDNYFRYDVCRWNSPFSALSYSASKIYCDHTGFLTDRLFEDRSHTVSATIYLNLIDVGSEEEQSEEEEILLILSTLSEEYYEHQRAVRGQIGGDWFTEPAPLYSNMDGGLGIFAGYSSVRVRIPTPE